MSCRPFRRGSPGKQGCLPRVGVWALENEDHSPPPPPVPASGPLSARRAPALPAPLAQGTRAGGPNLGGPSRVPHPTGTS